MKFSSAVIGGQLFLAATIFANPIADIATGLVAARFPAPMPAALFGPIGERGTDDEDNINCACLKLKRDAEAAADTAAEKSALYEKAVAVKKGLNECDTDDEDYNHTGCTKLKRDQDHVLRGDALFQHFSPAYHRAYLSPPPQKKDNYVSGS